MKKRATRRQPQFTHRAKKNVRYYRKLQQAMPPNGTLLKGSQVVVLSETGGVVRFLIEAQANAGSFEPLH
jgi:hypothetical protein